MVKMILLQNQRHQVRVEVMMKLKKQPIASLKLSLKSKILNKMKDFNSLLMCITTPFVQT